tara:strand:- start:1183 stop:1326 length:144 start_codon:yes stop_codon:yes gene_type:complete
MAEDATSNTEVSTVAEVKNILVDPKRPIYSSLIDTEETSNYLLDMIK